MAGPAGGVGWGEVVGGGGGLVGRWQNFTGLKESPIAPRREQAGEPSRPLEK